MERGLFNISDENVKVLIPKGSSSGSINSISICNCHASLGAKVRLFFDDDTNQTSLVENLVVPNGVTLVVDDLSFDNSSLSLKIQIEDSSGGSTVDTNIILK
jgi:hypothetical protein